MSSPVAASSTRPTAYNRRESETTALHKVVRDNLEAFLRFSHDNSARPPSRRVVRDFCLFVQSRGARPDDCAAFVRLTRAPYRMPPPKTRRTVPIAPARIHRISPITSA